jgi:hypothetical protein
MKEEKVVNSSNQRKFVTRDNPNAVQMHPVHHAKSTQSQTRDCYALVPIRRIISLVLALTRAIVPSLLLLLLLLQRRRVTPLSIPRVPRRLSNRRRRAPLLRHRTSHPAIRQRLRRLAALNSRLQGRRQPGPWGRGADTGRRRGNGAWVLRQARL